MRKIPAVILTARELGVKVFADAVAAAPEETLGRGADNLHLGILSEHVLGDMHLLGAAGREGGILANPFLGHVTAEKREAFLDVLGCLEAPDCDVAASLDALPHEHEVVAVHAFHEMFGRVDDVGLGHAFSEIADKGVDEARGRLRLAGNGADDAAVKDNGAVLRAGLAHLLDDSVGKRVDFGLGELALRGIVGAEADIKAVPVFPEAENVAGEGHAGIDKAEALAPAMGDNEIRLLPGSREGHADAGQIEALAGAVTDDHEAPLAQADGTGRAGNDHRRRVERKDRCL